MSSTASLRFDHLPTAEARLGSVFGRTRLIAVGCVVTLTALGWLYLGLMSAARSADTLGALCSAGAGVGTPVEIALSFAMWCAMALAMMLPSAAPMIVTYAEIADTAAAKGMQVVSPFVIALGYLAVWLGFSAVATAAQVTIARVASTDAVSLAGMPALTGILCLGAGLYQFSALKHACLSRCQRPFTVLFAHWQTQAPGVFRLGIRQGLDCLGCCWALMALMLAAGAMNILWMAALGAIMTIEKLSRTARFSYVVGIALIGLGLASLWFTVAA